MMNESMKYDSDKLPWDLLPMECVEQIVKVYDMGAKKYKPNSWQGLPNAENRYYSALMRHLVSWKNGEKIDQESGLLHTAHIGWNALALIYFDLEKNNGMEKY